MYLFINCIPFVSCFRFILKKGLTGAEDTPPVVMFIAAKTGLPETETTWASYLQQNGYLTQAVGKWHLGWDQDQYGDQKHGPRGHGFDHFYGLPFTLVDGFEKSHPFFTYEKLKSVRNISTYHGTTVTLGFMDLLSKGQIGNSEPSTVTNLPVYLINSEQIGISEQLCDDQKVP